MPGWKKPRQAGVPGLEQCILCASSCVVISHAGAIAQRSAVARKEGAPSVTAFRAPQLMQHRVGLPPSAGTPCSKPKPLTPAELAQAVFQGITAVLPCHVLGALMLP